MFPPALLAKHKCTVHNVTDAFIEDFIRHHVFPLYHPTSTCAIGKVVTANLKVRGIQGLRVADASVFPTNISGNTNAPSIMVGEKAADLMKQEHALKSVPTTTTPVVSNKAFWGLLGAAAVAAGAFVVSTASRSNASATQ